MKKLKRIEESKEYYKKSIEVNPEYPYSYLNLAVIYKENKDFEMAVKIIDDGIKNNSEQGFLYYNRACFYVHMNKSIEAFNDIKKSIELDDIFLEYMKKDRELDPIRELKEYREEYC